ncbi:MAG TPA: hypothetical protein VL997_17240 [Dyella sp.]|nr:hypothetical protein [Dyella sp.]
MNKRSIRISGLLTLGLLLATTAAGQTSSSSAAASHGAAQISEQDKTLNCPDGLVKFLPGEYYACEARADFGRGKYGDMMQMLEESASWANKDAQYQLGLAYFNGDLPGIPQNRPLGLAWLALAAQRGKQQYQIAYGIAQAQASPEDIRDASRLLQQMTPKYGDSVAAPRAIRYFNDAIKPIDRAAMYGGKVFIRGVTPFDVSSNFSVARWLHDEATAEFEDWHGTVTIGGPDWIQTPPSSSRSAQSGGQGNP